MPIELLYAIIGALFLVCGFFVVHWMSGKDDCQKECDNRLSEHENRLIRIEDKQEAQEDKLDDLDERVKYIEWHEKDKR